MRVEIRESKVENKKLSIFEIFFILYYFVFFCRLKFKVDVFREWKAGEREGNGIEKYCS